MPIFYYKAKKKSAETVAGRIAADNKGDAVEKIHRLDLVPIAIEEEGAGVLRTGALGLGRIKPADLYHFTRQLSGLLKSGLPLLRALEVIARQIKRPAFQRMIENIHFGVKEGRTFSDGLTEHPKVFSSFYVTMVKAGEESGNLKAILTDLAHYLRSQSEIVSKIRTAVAYPMLMAVFGAGTVCYVLTSVMPRIASLFQNLEQDLPWPTQVVMQASAFLLEQWPWLAVALVVILGLWNSWAKTKEGLLFKSQIRLSLPFLGELGLKAEMARFCRTLELLLKSGIPIVKAIHLAIPVVGNILIRDQLTTCLEELVAGRSLGDSLRAASRVPPLLGELIAIGEESGSLGTALGDIAESYEQEVNEAIKVMTALLEPLMIIVVGAMIGFIVMAMLMPVFHLDIMTR